MDHDPVFVQIGHVLVFAPFFLGQFHHRSHVILRHDNGSCHVRLRYLRDYRRIREGRGIVHQFDIPVGLVDLVHYVGGRGDQVQLVFPFQPLLDYIHVEQAQETAAEPEAQSGRGLRLKEQGRIVQLELFQGIPQVVVIRILHRVQAAEHHGRSLPVARQGFLRRMDGVGHRIAYPGLPYGLDGGRKKPDFPC